MRFLTVGGLAFVRFPVSELTRAPILVNLAQVQSVVEEESRPQSPANTRPWQPRTLHLRMAGNWEGVRAFGTLQELEKALDFVGGAQ